MFEADEVTSKDPSYIFCPAPHRKQLLHLFTKHFCQHPLFAECDGKWTKEKIHWEAVHDMYNFCYTHGLCEVWGYMWACWYSPKMWHLWTWSIPPYISCLWTTMNVKNFWWQLKHDYIFHIAWPHLDHLVWVLIYKVTPTYITQVEILNDSHRLGQTKSLTTYQKYFKASWKKLLERSHLDEVNSWSQTWQRHHRFCCRCATIWEYQSNMWCNMGWWSWKGGKKKNSKYYGLSASESIDLHILLKWTTTFLFINALV